MSTLRTQRETLEELWKQGLSGQALLAEQSRLADAFIVEHFQSSSTDKSSESIAVIALGGYGRSELFPYSDIDLLILFCEEAKEEMERVVNGILYPLWDTGLDVGHGVRTIEECLSHAREDFFFQVAMLDARLLAGSDSLFARLQKSYQAEFVDGAREAFVKTMKQFRDDRRKRFGSHSYLLEPNIKESKGGMRDIQAMLWTAMVVFGLRGIEAITDAGILVEDEKEDFLEAWNMLVRIRNRLHYISGRKNEQLYFEQQEEMAAAFGYRDSRGALAVESFMREFYGHLQTIAVTTDLFFGHVADVLGQTDSEPQKDRLVQKEIEIRKNRVRLLAQDEELSARPWLLMRVFLAAAKSGLAIHHRSRKLIRRNLGLLTDKLRSSARMSKPFLEILQTAEDVFPVLEMMLETGLLAAYIPEVARIESLAQHDVYHIYTVDRHLLQSVAELRQLIGSEEAVWKKVVSPKVLFLATLLHDIGKGAGGDHSVIGADLISNVGERMGFNRDECDRLQFVVRYHLFMPENALRRDLNDEQFIWQCAEKIQDSDRLAMLYLISVADSKATGPSAWSDWKATLLFEMYLKVLHCLESAVITDIQYQVDQGVDWLRSQADSLLAEEPQARAFVDALPSDYLLSFTPETVAAHARLHAENSDLLAKKALLFPEEMRSQWSLLIMCRDQSGLLAKICGVLSLHNLSVLNAQVFTWKNGSAVDLLEVRAEDGVIFEEMNWHAVEEDLNLALNHRLGLGHRLHKKLKNSHAKRKRPSGMSEASVLVDNDASKQYTIVEIHSSDSPGQLYRITQTLADFGISIFRAYIATEVERLIDVFYVLDSHGQKVTDDAHIAELREGILFGITGRA